MALVHSKLCPTMYWLLHQCMCACACLYWTISNTSNKTMHDLVQWNLYIFEINLVLILSLSLSLSLNNDITALQCRRRKSSYFVGIFSWLMSWHQQHKAVQGSQVNFVFISHWWERKERDERYTSSSGRSYRIQCCYPKCIQTLY